MLKHHISLHRLQLGFGALGAIVLFGCKDSMSPTVHGDINIPANASVLGNAAFPPNPFTVSLASGGTVVWANLDITSSGYGNTTGVSHHIVSDAPLFDSGVLNPNHTYSFTFTAQGNFPYHCSIHPGMVGTIHVTP